MNNKFDELAKGLAQSVTRRQALKKFGAGLAGMALACFGLANKAKAGSGTQGRGYCDISLVTIGKGHFLNGLCVDPNTCTAVFNTTDCPVGELVDKGGKQSPCGFLSNRACSTSQ